MYVIPAIDLKDGLCVRLLQGRKEDTTVYSDDPVATALKWESAGAGLLHIVDLDGAFTGRQKNFDSIRSIRQAVRMTIEVGGGIRDMETIDQLIALGVDRVILGAIAVENPRPRETGLLFPSRQDHRRHRREERFRRRQGMGRNDRGESDGSGHYDGGQRSRRHHLYRCGERRHDDGPEHRPDEGDGEGRLDSGHRLGRRFIPGRHPQADGDRRPLGRHHRQGLYSGAIDLAEAIGLASGGTG
ncbi:MAG: HisA/HisF-related TIM barrel protein [Ignavibacteriales bacterium]|nr:HisA/HisF-related TIM barrel protein [Ignavibacteriales bacterium]